ncbi:tail fiber protein [Cloacibacillus sp. An23]|uniref:phage tail protein n=1 Tax=Cloacibacillus sp. An23 TaxID=1965591 RepID=UPI001302259C|nr:tail fiber protein [Cloacibacillus sp. An23]
MARVREYGVDETGAPSSVLLGCAIGDIIPHFGSTPPPGTLVCDGSEISRETYHELYEEIGALCGPGDGSTTFNLPDLRGRWMVGADTERGAGEEVAEGLPDIVGTVGWVNDNLFTVASGAFSGVPGKNDYGVIAQPTSNTTLSRVNFNASASNPTYGASNHVTPASVAILPCIVYE